MPNRIVTLKYLKRRTGAVFVITFDDQSELEIDPELVVRHHLKIGACLDCDTLEQLRIEHAALVARRRLVIYLSGRRKTEKEARLYLVRLGFPDSVHETTLDAVRGLGLLDDRSYASAFTRTQQRTARKGPNAIRQELMMKGVHSDTAREAVSAISNRETQLEAARELAEKKGPALLRGNAQHATQKLAHFLIRKGYDHEVAIEVARNYFGTREED